MPGRDWPDLAEANKPARMELHEDRLAYPAAALTRVIGTARHPSLQPSCQISDEDFYAFYW